MSLDLETGISSRDKFNAASSLTLSQPQGQPPGQAERLPDGQSELERGELARRCTQALLTIVPQIRQIINRDSDGEAALLTVQQYSVLKALKDQQRLISELADMLKVSRPTMSRIIDGLEGRRRSTSEENRRPKLVERVACQDDHRLVYAHITEEGRSFLRHYCLQAEENITEVLRRIPPDNLPVLLGSLEALTRALQTRN